MLVIVGPSLLDLADLLQVSVREMTLISFGGDFGAFFGSVLGEYLFRQCTDAYPSLLVVAKYARHACPFVSFENSVGDVQILQCAKGDHLVYAAHRSVEHSHSVGWHPRCHGNPHLLLGVRGRNRRNWYVDTFILSTSSFSFGPAIAILF